MRQGQVWARLVGLPSVRWALPWHTAWRSQLCLLAVGHISGGHFNPAISIGFWVTRRLSTFDALSYCVVQLGGATVAAYVLRYAIPEATWGAVFLGTPDLAGGLTRSPAMLIEGLGAFVVTFAVFLEHAGYCQS